MSFYAVFYGKKYLQFGTMFQQLFETKKYDLNMIAFFKLNPIVVKKESTSNLVNLPLSSSYMRMYMCILLAIQV